jgi:uncharacterized protein YqeY
MLRDQIKTDMVFAQKSGDKQKLDTLRFLLGEIANFEIEKYPPSVGGTLTDEDTLSVIKKQVKRHQESIEMFKTGKREDLVSKEQAELVVLQNYLPAQMSDEELKTIVKRIVESNSGKNFGEIMKLVMVEVGGKADGGAVSKILKEQLS